MGHGGKKKTKKKHLGTMPTAAAAASSDDSAAGVKSHTGDNNTIDLSTDEGNDDLQKGIALSLQDQQKIKGFQESETLQGMRLHTGNKPYQIINAISAISVLKTKGFKKVKLYLLYTVGFCN